MSVEQINLSQLQVLVPAIKFTLVYFVSMVLGFAVSSVYCRIKEKNIKNKILIKGAR